MFCDKKKLLKRMLKSQVYSGFGFAAGFNNGTWPVLQDVLKDPKASPYRDFFLQGSSKTVETQTYCQQGHTSGSATAGHCLAYFLRGI
jgi:hypothetical protein